MNSVLIIPDGFGVRNFILGRLLNLALGQGAVHVLHTAPPEAIESYDKLSGGTVNWQPLIPNQEGPLPFTLRYSLAYAHMYWANTSAMREFVLRLPISKLVKGSWRVKASHHIAKTIGRFSGSHQGVMRLNRLYVQTSEQKREVRHYQELFSKLKPDVVFSSNQWVPAVLPPIIAARSMGIPTATFIFSWDNITTKGRIAAPFDHYLVWSDHMRGELMQYYPDITEDRIHVIGTPQFEPYVDDSLILPKAEFFQQIGADPNRPLICFSGGIPGTTPDDQHHVRIIMELIREGKIQGNPQVMIRPAPPDRSGRYEAVCRDYPEIIFSQPQWFYPKESRFSASPMPSDIRLMANLTRHCDLNINMASTMTIDFAIQDKPVINLAFDATTPPPFDTPIWDLFYRFDHYRPVVELGAAKFPQTREALAADINAYLENPALDREGRRKIVDLEIGQPLGISSQLIIDTLRAISGERVPAR